MKRPIIFTVAAHIVAWMILTVADYFDEMTTSDLALVLFFAGPVIAAIVYLICRKKIWGSSALSWWKKMLIGAGIWLGTSVVFGVPICILVSYNKWIVHQATEGVINLVNGFEYPVFAVFYALFPALIMILAEVLLFLLGLVRKIRARNEAKRMKELEEMYKLDKSDE